MIARDERGEFHADEVAEQYERRIEMRSGEIQSSLYVATDKALIPGAVADQIVKMFETNIDFYKLQRGDYFNIVYETFWQNGEMVKPVVCYLVNSVTLANCSKPCGLMKVRAKVVTTVSMGSL